MGNTIEVRIRTVVWTVTVAALSIAATLTSSHQAWSADAAPGDSDSTYVPTAGCRAFDLRPAPNQVGPRPAPLAAGEIYTQQITGNVGDCTGQLAIPADAVAVAMNVTAVNPTAQTNLRLFPANLSDVPTLSNLNVSAGQAPFPNKVDVALSPSGAIKIFNQNGSVSVLGDIVGYCTTSSLTEIDTRLAALEANDSAQDGEIAANKTWIDGLVATQPFTVFDYEPDDQFLTASSQTILTVEITAPSDGRVTAMSDATVTHSGLADDDVVCGIFPSSEPGPGATIIASYIQWFERGATAGEGTLSGNRTFSVTEGQKLIIEWRCLERGNGGLGPGSCTRSNIHTRAMTVDVARKRWSPDRDAAW